MPVRIVQHPEKCGVGDCQMLGGLNRNTCGELRPF